MLQHLLSPEDFSQHTTAATPRPARHRQLLRRQPPPAERALRVPRHREQICSYPSRRPGICPSCVSSSLSFNLCSTHATFSMNFQGRQRYSQKSFKALDFYSIKSNGEVKPRIAILTTFCQSEVLAMKCNWQEQRISDNFRQCQDRQLNKWQINAHCSIVLPSAPRVLPESVTPLAHNAHQSMPG